MSVRDGRGAIITTVAMCAAKSRAPASAAAGHYSQLKVSTGILLHTSSWLAVGLGHHVHVSYNKN